jgi:tetratricopeptide (TPR) repeat protein
MAAVAAARPIEIEVGPGRNSNVVKLVDQGQAELSKGDLAAARRSLDSAIQTDPTYWPALYVRAQVLVKQHQGELAIQDCDRILRQDSTVIEAALLRATINLQLGRSAASLKEINHVVSIHPRVDALARAYNARAVFRLYCSDPSLRNPQLAVADATSACKLMQWSDGDMIDTLASAYAATGNFESASRYEQQALAAKDITNEDKQVYQKRLNLFREHRTTEHSSRSR